MAVLFLPMLTVTIITKVFTFIRISGGQGGVECDSGSKYVNVI